MGRFQALGKAFSLLENLRRGEVPQPRWLVTQQTWPELPACISEMLSTIWLHGALVAAAVCVLSSSSKGGLDTSMLIRNIDTAGASLEAL